MSLVCPQLHPASHLALVSKADMIVQMLMQDPEKNGPKAISQARASCWFMAGLQETKNPPVRAGWASVAMTDDGKSGGAVVCGPTSLTFPFCTKTDAQSQ
jgi:hypothetical protein